MTFTAEIQAEPELIPLDALRSRLERAINRHQPSDHRDRLLGRLRAGPEFDYDPRQPLTRGQAVRFRGPNPPQRPPRRQVHERPAAVRRLLPSLPGLPGS